MNISNADRAEVLAQALHHIQKYAGKTIVVKYGGNAMTSPELKDAVMGDLIFLSSVGIRIVLVHGGGPEISDMLHRVGKESVFKNGLRVTDAETVEIVQMVLAGKVNKGLVSLIQKKGGRAIGLSGQDGGMILSEMKNPDLGYVGEITEINPKPILDVLDAGYIPVISTVGCDTDGNSYNINADTAAARIAGVLGAECLITMTDIEGILRDKNDPSTLISKIVVSDVRGLMQEGIISGGMIPKIECCVEAIRRGVGKVFVIDGRVKHSIIMETLTDEGLGTMLVQG